MESKLIPLPLRRARGLLFLGWPVLALAVIAAGCGQAAVPASQSGGGPPIALKIGVPAPGGTQYAPHFVAKERGFFDKYNVKPTITEYNGAGPAQEALASGDADLIHFFPPSVAGAVKKGVKEKIVATWEDRPLTWHMETKADSSIKSASDLNGKRVGISGKGTATDMLSLWVAQKNGVKIESVPLGAPQATYAAIIAGQVEAGVISSPTSLRGLATGEARSLFDYGKNMAPNMFDVLVASDDMIQRQPAAVANYLKALFEAVRYMKQNREATIDYLVKFTKNDRATVERDYEGTILGLSEDVSVQKESLDNSLQLAGLVGINDLPSADQISTTQFMAKR